MKPILQPSRSALALEIAGVMALMLGAVACSASPSALAPAQPSATPGLDRPVQAQTPSDWAQIERDIVAFQNQARQDPASLIPLLEARLAAMNEAGYIVNGCGRNCNIVTQEGKAAVQEAIAFLRQQAALSPLAASDQVAQAAQAHAQDQANGAMGHVGSDGSSPGDRIDRAGALNTGSGENIAYGSATGQEVILDLIVDDGVPDRGHRVNIFAPNWTHTGAGCGPHEGYGLVCVINYITFSPQLTVVHRGTVVLESLALGGRSLLPGPLAPGETRTFTLTDSQCQADLTIQMRGYQPLPWPDRSLCGATLTVDAGNGFEISY